VPTPYRLRISIEMKDREVTGPLLAQIVGSALRDEENVKDIVVICRSVNRGALKDAIRHESKHNIRIIFIEDEVK
jgi:hypothetical protein